MFDGNTFLPVTGTPMREIVCMMRPFAEADPVPLAVAILNAKSLVRSIKLKLPATSCQLRAASSEILGHVASGLEAGSWKLGAGFHTAASGMTFPARLPA